jgi:hypothetical protein
MSHLKTLKNLFLVTGLMLLPPCAKAAEITSSQYSDGKYLIRVAGTIELGDEKVFARIANAIPETDRVEVVLTGRGGVVEGLLIGMLIHKRKFETIAMDYCASMCADIWVAGEKRSMYPGTILGFHAAGKKCDTGICESGSGNALIGAYFNELGLSWKAIATLTKTPPDSVLYISPNLFTELGISYTIYTVGGEEQH